MYSFKIENPLNKYIDCYYLEELFALDGLIGGGLYFSYKLNGDTKYICALSPQDIYDSSFIYSTDIQPMKLMFRFENSLNYLKKDISVGASGAVIKEFIDVIDGDMIRECSIDEIEMALRMYTTPLGQHEENILMLRMAAYKAVKKRITGE